MLDWAVYLKYLQSILLEYNPVGAPTEPTMFRYFRKGLKPSVLVELEHQDLKLENFDQMVKKAVNAKAESALCLCSSTKEMNQNCFRGNWPVNSTVAKSHDGVMKDFRMEKPKVRGKEAPSGPQRSESSEKTWKEKKKE